MNVKFIINDYALIWNLLFQASISESISKLKQKLWNTYREQYDQTYKDKLEIVGDHKNFIPNDDTIYNIIIDDKNYSKIKRQAEKYRQEIMALWDKNKKETTTLLNKIMRLELPDYTFFIVNKELSVVEHPVKGSMIIGKTISQKAPMNIIYEILLSISMNNIKRYKNEDNNFKKAIVELAILNEYATRINNRSCYLSGNPELLSLKKNIYPYWLMYLGVKKEEFPTFMVRDKVSFDPEKYTYDEDLKKMDLEEFIDYCVANKKTIIREQ